jgi:glycine betaine/proline transport system ATP-binding protein
MAETTVAVSIRGLSKIFGPEPRRWMPAVNEGLDKATLRDRHGHVLALHDVSLDIHAGGIQVLLGLSGSGKSTLIRHLNRLIEPTAGAVNLVFEGRTVDLLQLPPAALRRFRRQQASMVFQRFALLPHLTVLDNVAFGLVLRGDTRDTRITAARRWINRVGLGGYESHYPRQLSGGMQQRVGLARALANDAPLMLMDEPFSALDPLLRRDMQALLMDLQQELHKTMVFITHDVQEALRLGRHIALLRDGRLLQQGTPEQILQAPADPHVAAFMHCATRDGA